MLVQTLIINTNLGNFFLKRNLEVSDCALHGLLVDRKSEAGRQGTGFIVIEKLCVVWTDVATFSKIPFLFRPHLQMSICCRSVS